MNLFNLSATLTLDTSNYDSKIKSPASETDSLGSQTSSSETALSKFGVMFANVAANYVTQFISKIEEAISSVYEIGTATETAYAKLETIAGTENIDELTDALEDLSVQSGISSADLAETAYQAISAGTSAEDAAEMVEIAGKLATGGFTDSTTAVDVLTTAINAYGYSAEDAEAIADSLIQTQNLGKTTVDELASGMGKAIASGSAYGVSLGNIEAAYVGMTSQGIDTAEATTYMNSMIKELGDSSSDVASIIQDETGQSFSELMDSGYSLADVLQILYDNCEGDTTALQNLWSSSEAGLAANALVSDGLEDFNENLEAIENSSGTTEEAYATMSDTLSFKTSTMQTSFQDLALQLYDKVEPALSTMVDVVTDYVIPALQWCIDNAPVIITLIAGIAAAIATINAGSIASQISKVGTSVSSLFSTLLANPFAIIVVAIAALVAAFIYLWNNCEEFRDFWINAWEQIKKVVQTVTSTIKNLITTIVTKVTNAYNSIKDTLSKIKEKFTSIFTAIKTKVTTLVNGIKTAITSPISSAYSKITSILGNVKSKFTSVFSGIKSKVMSILTSLKSSITSWGTNLVSKFKSIGKNLVSGLWSGISDKVTWVINKIKGMGSSITKAIKSVFGISSPSKVFAEIGGYLAEGLGEGWEDSYASVEKQITSGLNYSGSLDLDTAQSESSLESTLSNNVSLALSSQMDRILTVMEEYFPQFGNQAIYLDGDTLVSATADRIDSALGKMATRKARLA